MDEARKRHFMKARDIIPEAFACELSIVKLCNYLLSEGELTEENVLGIK